MHLFGYCNTASSHSSKDLCSAQKEKEKMRAILVQEWKGFYSTEQRQAIYQIIVESCSSTNERKKVGLYDVKIRHDQASPH